MAPTSFETHESDGFILSEIFYAACLETLFSAYIVPLSNTVRLPYSSTGPSPSTCTDYTALLRTFGGDVLDVLACHRALINSLQALKESGEDGASTNAPSGDEGESQTNNVLTVLHQVLPAMRASYQRYVTNFHINVQQAELAKTSVSANVWSISYITLARGTLAKCLFDLGVEVEGVTLLADSGNVSFEALVALPVRHIARYPLYIEDWIGARRGTAADGTTIIQYAQETLKAFRGICSAANAVRSELLQVQKAAELKRMLGVTKLTSRFISEGDVAVMFTRETTIETLEGRYCRGRLFLLDDCLIFALRSDSSKEGAMQMKRIPLANILSVRSLLCGVRCGVQISYAILERWRKWVCNERVQCAVVFVSNETEVILWVHDISQAVSDLVAKT
ncbi:putative DNA topoisomerase III [Trypanosoma grayi]|uniref:putative DNA topoisomerase III n=1 Tax=Trypanosoma grayi TaxID=71804 RepID=UPI0004F46744|nr:putative DNA topoisomerase III [Trypanosoma grayi]KEG06211.1 putative DNA topoisomerase III [Trypanosoma grayi]